MICNCVDCFPRLNTASKGGSNAWCIMKKNNNNYSNLGDLLENLPLDCMRLILISLTNIEILKVRMTCKSAYLCNFVLLSDFRLLAPSCCFTYGLKAINIIINPMTLGICSYCFKKTLWPGMMCHECCAFCEVSQKEHTDHLSDWWNMDDVSSSFLKKRERRGRMNCLSIEDSKEFFQNDFWE